MNEFNSEENFEKEPTASEPVQQNDEITEDNPIEKEIKSSFTPVNYSAVNPITDYKPMSKGLKVFAVAIAAVILLTGSCMTGYLIGKNSTDRLTGKNVSVNLAAKPADTDESTASEVYEQVDKSIVGICVYNAAGSASYASGVIYSKDGYIVTNDHIYSEIGAPKFKVYAADGKEYDAEYVAGDKISDLAILKVKSADFTPAVFGNSGELINGENVVAIGRPNDATEDSSITKGIVSSVSRRVNTTSNYSARLIQTDSAINPGSSGGALVNMYGQVVGITSSKLAGVQYDSVGYAIPTTIVKRIAEELIKDGKVTTRAKLGISYTAVNSVTAEIKGYNNVGLYVAAVNDDSDLYGHIKVGDIITHINGIEITDDDIVLDIIEDAHAGDKVTITVAASNGGSTDYTVTLKANIGESSYNSEISESSSSAQQDGSSSNNGAFNFPSGE